MNWVEAYISLGSNLNDPLHQVELACQALQNLDNSELLEVSSWYQSKAVGPGEQADYINGVCKLCTKLSPEHLLNSLHTIEANQGRVRRERWGARTLDLDILLYGQTVMNTEQLQIPHPRLHERNFVLYPLNEIAGDLQIPTPDLSKKVTIESLLCQVGTEHLIRLEREETSGWKLAP